MHLDAWTPKRPFTGGQSGDTATGVSQGELAFRAELNRGYVNGIERFVRNRTVVVLQKLANALGADITELVARP